MANVPLQPKTSNFLCLWRGSPTFRKMARCTQALDSEVSLFPQISPAQAFHIFLRENVSLVDWFTPSRVTKPFHFSSLPTLHPSASAFLLRSTQPFLREIARRAWPGGYGANGFLTRGGERGRRGGNESDRREPTQGGASAGKDREGAGRLRPFRRYL